MTQQKRGKPNRKIITAIIILAIIPALIILYNRYEALMQQQKTQMSKQPTAPDHQKAKRNHIAKAKKQQPQKNQSVENKNITVSPPPSSETPKDDAANLRNAEPSSDQAASRHAAEDRTLPVITTAGEIEATRIARGTTNPKGYVPKKTSPVDRLHNTINVPDESPKKPYNPVIWFDTNNKNQASYE